MRFFLREENVLGVLASLCLVIVLYILGWMFVELIKKEKEWNTAPIVGSQWTTIISQRNPFEQHPTNTVLSVEGNYVLYTNQTGATNSTTIPLFRHGLEQLPMAEKQ